MESKNMQQPMVHQPQAVTQQQPAGMMAPPTYNETHQHPGAMMATPMYNQPQAVLQQPSSTVTNVNIVSPVMQFDQPIAAPENIRRWSVGGVCACCNDCGVCLCGWCCPCCLVYDVTQAMGENCCFVHCYPLSGIAMLRTKLRVQYGISGDLCNDYCCSMWCGACVLCQLKRQLKQFGRC